MRKAVISKRRVLALRSFCGNELAILENPSVSPRWVIGAVETPACDLVHARAGENLAQVEGQIS
jgi:hypothetical protein